MFLKEKKEKWVRSYGNFYAGYSPVTITTTTSLVQPAKKMSVDITLSWRTGSPRAGDGYHRRPGKAKVSASGPRRRADTDGNEGKSAPVYRWGGGGGG